MQIAYINRAKAAKQTENEKILQAFRDRDIRLAYRKYKSRIDALCISEEEFIKEMKKG